MIRVTRSDHGDITATTEPPGDMTAAELAEALGRMPPGAVVRRYGNGWTVREVQYDSCEKAVDLY